MFIRELILVGLLTSLLLTVVLYIFIGDDDSSAGNSDFTSSSQFIVSKKQTQLRGSADILLPTSNSFKNFICNDRSNSKAIENDNFCDCKDYSDQLIDFLMYM